MKNLDMESTSADDKALREKTNDGQKAYQRLSAHKLFGFFTASIIKKRVKFTR